jgi:hypothetical protein
MRIGRFAEFMISPVFMAGGCRCQLEILYMGKNNEVFPLPAELHMNSKNLCKAQARTLCDTKLKSLRHK